MRSLSKKTRYLIILVSLLLLLLFTGLSLANHAVPAQAESSPTITAQEGEAETYLKSGDTEGLILGAGIILFIILSGVIIQRSILKSHDE